MLRTEADKQIWLEDARLDAIVGSCRRSLPSVRSGIRCWFAFLDATVGTDTYFPPKAEWLVAWSKLFRSVNVFRNYLGYVKTGCLLVRADVLVFKDPSVCRAKASVAKSGQFESRPRMWIRKDLLESMVKHCVKKAVHLAFVPLFVLAYAFLLRLPSEALPAVAGRDRDVPEASAILSKTSGDAGVELVLTLRRRKNKLGGSRLVRGCWCSKSPTVCPVHVLGPIVDATPEGQPLFPGLTARTAMCSLRAILKALKVKDSHAYGTHDFRRGHALDLERSGAPLWQILAAGEWRSPAYLRYLDLNLIDRDVVVQAHMDEDTEEEA